MSNNISNINNSQSEEVFIFPTSYGQKRMWFLDQFEPGSPYYNIPMAFKIKGRFERELFFKTIDYIVERHESIRTTFADIKGEPYQVINPDMKITVAEIDISNYETTVIDEKFKQIATNEARLPFNISEGPLFRATLIKIAPTENIVLITMHHIISDGWSMGILLEEITSVYTSQLNGQNIDLPELELQYADFSEWQNEYLSAEVLESHINYWKNQLATSNSHLDLPTDRNRPAIWTNNGSTAEGFISPEVIEELQKISNKQNATLFMTLVAAFNILLYKYSGQDDINIGTPIANRTDKNIEKIVGLFLNTLVLRTDLSENPTFLQLLSRVRKTNLEAFEHQDLPFEMLVDTIQPERDMSYAPLFQVMMILHNNPVKTTKISDVEISMLSFDMGTATSDITYSISVNGGAICSIEYNTDLFDESTVIRMFNEFNSLLKEIANNPNKRISSYKFLDEMHKNKILYEWNSRELDFPKINSIHSFVEQWAISNPETVCVVDNDTKINYRTLNEKSNQLAHYLIEKNINKNLPVGISLEKSVNLIITVLGVLKSGYAYLPLDPTYPEDRLNYMIHDSEIELLITDTTNSEIFNSFEYEQINIDQLIELNNYPTDNPEVEIRPNDLAYIIYTSGSTGRAKGTMVQHNSLINIYLGWEKDYKLLDEVKNHLQMASFSFDVFSGDWIRALCSGGKLVLVKRDQLLDAQKLYEIIISENIDIGEFVPAVLRNLISFCDDNSLKLNSFKVLIAGSDSWSVREYKEFKKYCSSECRLINSFGLTETAIDSTFFESKELNLSDDRLVPIGKPFPNIKLYILDDYLNIVPIGTRGELYIGGISLARGYYKRPNLTAERFLPNLYSSDPGDRLYKTGDKAKYLSDGNIEFLGRADNQVKIRGFRVELGEIENVLSEYDDIKDAIVLLHGVSEEDKIIVAYIILKNDIESNQNKIREFIAERVPDYMVPSAYVILDKFPLTPNGKVDRKSLPAPNQDELLKVSDVNFVEPRNETEKMLAEIWIAVLNIDSVGIFHNFFIVGGHSLLATKVISRIKTKFNINLPLRIFFEKPTIDELADEIELLKLKSTNAVESKIQPRKNNSNIPLSFAQERLWFLDQLEPNSPFYNIPESYRIVGNIDIDIVKKCFNTIVKRHEILRTYFISVDGRPFQVIQDDLDLEIPVVDLCDFEENVREEKSKQIVQDEARKPISMDELPLFRLKIIKLSDEDHIFLMTIHHIISDDWSTNIIVSELGFLYQQYENNNKLQLPAPSIQYADFAIWQREWLKDEILDSQVNYWKERLSGLPPLLELPTDYPRPKLQTFEGDFKVFDISTELSQKINSLSKSENVTVFMIMLALFKLFLYKISDQNDICIGTPSANRNREEIESILGFFVNTLVIRTDCSNNPTFTEFLQRVKESTVGAYSHQDLPFEYIVDAIKPERNLSHSPIFQVMFVYQTGEEKEEKSNYNWTIKPVTEHSQTSKFDLTLFVSHSGEQISGGFEYNSDLFSETTVDKFIEYFTSLLTEATNDKSKRIEKIPLQSTKKQLEIIDSLNQTAEMPVLNDIVPIEFSKMAKSNLNKPAVYAMNQNYSFETLEIESNKLANYLIELGITTEQIVGICLSRSFDLIVSLLGILKSGGAYLPIDPNYPTERIDYIVEDSETKIVITEKRYADSFRAEQIRVICFEDIIDSLKIMSKEYPAVDIDKKNTCYIIYTSGSTGKPKGTLITHEGLANYISWTHFAYPSNQENGSLVHSTVSFDATITSIFPSLLSGNRIILMDEEKDIDEIANVLENNDKFSVIKITPAHLDLLSNLIRENTANNIAESIVVGGENLTVNQIEYWQKYAPDMEIFNEYGPTEAVVGCIVYECAKYLGKGSVPIGRVIPNMKIYVLDHNLSNVPIGVSGELYLGGVSLARGYLNKPDMTAEKFIPNPFSTQTGERIYKTGDRVKIQSDGNLIFIGRLDDQIKIRGYRIELDEVKQILDRQSLVKESVVIVREVSENVKILAAYIVSDEKVAENINQFKEYLESYLPDYMVPTHFIQIEKIPLTINGKIDKNQLPHFDIEKYDANKEYVSPETDHEKILAKIWSSVLSIDKISVNDNFFELGGDSILSIQIIARAKKAGLGLLPRHIFEFPTIQTLAKAVDKKHIIYSDQSIVVGEIEPVPIYEWFFEQNYKTPNHYNQSIFINLDIGLNLEELKLITLEMIEHHDILRLRVNENNGDRNYVITDVDDNIPVEYFDYSGTDTKHLQVKINETAETMQSSLDFNNGPVFKVAYFDLGPKSSNILMVIFHHLVIDGVSWRIVLEDFNTALYQLKQGIKISLPPKTTSFKYWAKMLNDQVASGRFDNELDYWSNITTDAESLFPIDYSKGDNTEGFMKSYEINLSPEDTKALLHEINVVYKTSIMDILLSALAVSIRHFTNQNEVIIDLEGHGRDDIIDGIDLSRTVGWFTNIYPVLLNVEDNHNYDKLVKSVKAQIREIPNHGLGYGLLRYLSSKEDSIKKLDSLISPNIIFNYLGHFGGNNNKNDSETNVYSKGHERSLDQTRSHLIDINGSIANGILKFIFNYSSNHFNKETIEKFAKLYAESLISIIHHCQNVGVETFDESEFEQFGWGKEDIDDILSEIDNI